MGDGSCKNCFDGVNVHTRALCEGNGIGRGTQIWAYAHVMEGVHLGSNCKFGTCVFMECRAYVGDSVAVISGVKV